MNGKVKWFDGNKGFGFIACEGNHPDVFVHHTSILGQKGRRNLFEGQEVEFRVESGDRGPKAVDVKVVGEAPAPRYSGRSSRFSGADSR